MNKQIYSNDTEVRRKTFTTDLLITDVTEMQASNCFFPLEAKTCVLFVDNKV